ncbi:MAG: Zn-dependent hydrolase [Chryseobacterium sp.]|nr:MAG: Zn-dependent hydrolase [Chryseobacterium sp.]
MELQYYGANALKLSTKKSTIFIDPASDITSLSVDTKKANTILVTQPTLQPSSTDGVFFIDGPGEYEFEDYSIKGIAAQPHTAASGDKSATMYWINSGDARILVTGHIDAKLSEEQLEAIGVVDVVIIPVGGGGYTLDSVGATAVVTAVEPKLIVPVHAGDDGFKYDVPQAEIDLFVKESGIPTTEEAVEKLKFKSFPEQMTIQLVNKS